MRPRFQVSTPIQLRVEQHDRGQLHFRALYFSIIIIARRKQVNGETDWLADVLESPCLC